MHTKTTALFVLVMSLVISSCGPEKSFAPGVTPALTASSTPTRISTPLSTQISIPTLTQSPTTIPIAQTYNPAPRWMMLGQPGYNVEILGESWEYQNDNWGETVACSDYTRKNGTEMFLEECFSIVDDPSSFDDQVAGLVEQGFELLTPQATFDEAGQISLLGINVERDSNKLAVFIELAGAEKYLSLVEMHIATDDATPSQTIYESRAADIIDYVLRDSLQKSRILPRPTATPLSPDQESLYASLSPKLITELEASGLDGDNWETLGDGVDTKSKGVCRTFENRTNEDALWVSFGNCILHAEGFNFEDLAGRYQNPGDAILESRYAYDDLFFLAGYVDGHTFFYAYLLHGEYVYISYLETRTMVGQSVEEVFTADVDDFLHDVLMVNSQK